jgi:hypothetical protein
MNNVTEKADFARLGEQIVATLKKAGEDRVVEANNLLASVTTLAEHIVAQLGEHEKLLNEMDEKVRDFGKSVLEAHNRFLNGAAK